MRFFLFAAAWLTVLLLPAQEFRSTLSGLVTDPSGAAIPGASVVVVDKATGARYQTTTNVAGSYVLPLLPPGAYSLTVEATGFKKYIQEQIQIGTNQRVGQDVVLQVGAQAESVTVTADVSLLQTTTASVGQVINTRTIESIPMNGRTPLTLAQLSYGVIPNSDPRFTRPFDNAGPSGFSMGGGQAQTNELLLDGAPDMTRNRRVAFNPPVDTVQEIKVEAFQPDAAYGNTGGGTVNVVLKSGTNDFHGSAYEFNQVSRLKATPFFTNAAGQLKPVTRFNQYGLTVGGPVIVPKLVNGRNRLFFYFAYEGIRQSEPEPTFSTVPTQAQRNGDLSALLQVGSIYQIYDPATGVREGTRIRRQPFPNNIIPAARLHPVSKNILGFIPTPNTTGTADGLNNYFNNTVRSDTFYSYMGRADFNASDRHKLFFSFRTNDRVENRGNRFGNIVTGNFLSRVNWGATFDDVYTVTPTLLVNTRLNWTRFVEGSTRPSDGFDFTTLGFPAALKAASTRLVFPIIDFSAFTDIGNSGGDSTPFDSYQIFSTVTKIAGAHSLKMGIDLRRSIESSNAFGNSSGAYSFNESWARGPLDNSPAAPLGQDLTAFLLGTPTGGNFQVNSSRTQHADYYSAFIQDDWRVSANLTLNMGLRYERETGTVERFNRTVVGFDAAAVNRLTRQAEANYAASPSPLRPPSQFHATGGVVFASPGNRSVYDTYPWAFSPRFGFSYSPSLLGGKTVLRGGVGLFYYTAGTFGIQQPGFSQTTPLPANINNFLSPVYTLSNPFPDGILQPVGSSLGVDTFLGQSVRYVNRDLAQPYTWRWNFNIQREFGANLVLELGYMGSRATKLAETRNLNFVPISYLSTSPTRDQATIDRLTALVPNPFRGLLPGTGLNGNTVAVEQLLRAFPQFSGEGGVSVEALNTGNSDFHMFQVRVEKRFSSGFQLLSNFQWSKFIEATGRLFAAAPQLERRIAGEDRPYRFVFAGTYDLPFGRGRAVGGDASRGLDLLIGGWQFNGIYTLQPGPPIGWGNVIYLGGDLQYDARNLNRAFDTTRFVTDPRLQLDRNVRTFNSGFSAYRADAVNNIDFSVIKQFPVYERVKIQLRAESFNLFNRASFNGPDTNPTSRNFGRITSQANLARTIQMALRLTF